MLIIIISVLSDKPTNNDIEEAVKIVPDVDERDKIKRLLTDENTRTILKQIVA